MNSEMERSRRGERKKRSGWGRVGCSVGWGPGVRPAWWDGAPCVCVCTCREDVCMYIGERSASFSVCFNLQ